ncbi:MAG: nitroreductase family protein [Anaerolineae bacterium]|nr:nitroreductase family protein [Thermoflexales bacterium]MCX7939517.1 nitroreductase family protein [Thermoflexales bacterium]MDW8054715.1 nitroreductase family protein [Anaerolineae bacterium]
MDLLEAIRRRKTTNTPFAPTPVRDEHKRLLIEAAARAPSHFNSQPWRFILIEDRARIERIADLAGAAMKALMEDGRFVARYRRYFRFDPQSAMHTGSGIYFDRIPAPLRPLVQLVFSEQVGPLLSRLGAATILANDQRNIVRSAPLLLAITLDKQEYQPGELSGLYAVITLGAVIQTLWLVTTALEMGMQFISVILESPPHAAQLVELLGVPEDQALVAIFRMGYRDPNAPRNTIDWTSNQRKPFHELVHYNAWGTPAPQTLRDAPSLLWQDAALPEQP